MKIRCTGLCFVTAALAAGFLRLASPMAQAADVAAPAGSGATLERPALTVGVDPRVELLSVIFRLAGNPEYNQGKVESYTADVEQQFKAFRQHAAVALAAELRRRRGVSYDACMSLAVHLRSVADLSLLVPLEPWPDGLDQRWTAADVDKFLECARQFVQETSFTAFLDQHRALYATTESRLRALMEKEGHLEWFKDYFGERSQAKFNLVPALLNGGSCYGPHCREAAGKEDLYCILGVWNTDAAGLPRFTRDMLSTVVHEFAHSYANPVVDRHLSELQPAGDELYRHVSAKMRSQAYGNSQTMLRESLVRACEVRYAVRYDGLPAGKRAIAYNQGRGFLWTEELSGLLAEYETHRGQYPDLDAFAPRMVAFFNEYSRGFAERQKALEAKQPKVVSIAPANGAQDVDPQLTAIRVVFDRPMRDRSWSLVGGGPHCPESAGQPAYDTSRTTWTFPVKLKPDWDYEFMLNSETYDAFRSEAGVPLEPLHVSFKTRKE